MPARIDFRAGIFRHFKPVKNCFSALVCLAAFIVGACSEKPPSESKAKETESQPREDQIAEDCVAFVHTTKIVPGQAECPGCSAESREAFSFRDMRVERIACSAGGCDVTVTLRAKFNPGPAGTISGGLSAWISPEQRQAFLDGRTPEGEQAYAVKVIYQRRGDEWRAIEFDRAELK